MQAKGPSLLVAVLVTSAIALLDAWTGDRAVLLGLLIAGPLLAAAGLDAPRTAMVGLYALGLAVLLGIPRRHRWHHRTPAGLPGGGDRWSRLDRVAAPHRETARHPDGQPSAAAPRDPPA